MNFKTNLAILIGTLGLLSSCSHGPSVQEFPDSASATDEIQKLDTDVRASVTHQANLLAPKNFSQAQNALDDAKSAQAKGKDSRDILHRVAEGRAYLNRANDLVQTSRINMEDVVNARQLAIDAGAQNHWGKDFRTADENLLSVTSEVEKGDLSSVEQSRSKLQSQYRALELKSIDHTNLDPARDTIKQAIREGAEEYASKTLALTKKQLNDTTAFITANRHDTSQIKQRAEVTRNSAEHLLKITRNSKAGKKTSSEDLALQMEGEQSKTQDKQTQLDSKQTQLTNKETELENKKSELTEERDSSEALAVQTKKLEANKAFNQLFEEARAEFTESEAEVYKQGNKLTIRLKGLEFPVRAAVLKGSNFPLLAKVQKVLKEFGKSTVSVEGHTDSNGGKLLNDKLSADRAEAVSQYLVSNDSIAKASITSVGYGFQKPLATNKTASGRAQNRRVDVVITPEETPAI